MNTPGQITGKVTYALVFLVLLPSALVLWAKYIGQQIIFPAISSKPAGRIMMASGGLLLLWAMWALLKYGKGLPMSAYPPPVYVSRGPYRIFRHPIYWGFVIFLTGFFLFAGSAGGFWFVSPMTILGIIALVMGYEEPDLRKRFPGRKKKTILVLPDNNPDVPGSLARIVSALRVISFLILCNFLIITLGKPLDINLTGSFDMLNDLREDYLIFSGFVFIALIPFVLKNNDLLRKWEISTHLSLSFLLFIAILYPSFAEQHYSAGRYLLFNTPAFLILISLKVLFRQSYKLGILFTVIGMIPVFFQVSASKSELVYLSGTVFLFLFSSFYLNIWNFLRNFSQKIANSWKEWVFGKIRVLNRGFYIGTGTFLGILLAGFLAGEEYVFVLFVFSVIVTITAGLWAQLIEGSARLKRPFGFYGGLAGIAFGTLAVWALGYNAWVIIGVASVVMPWMQAIGRMGCLINGCCHGSPIDDPMIGIRYFHPRSRVCNISGLKGELLHPTQLYSILWLLFVGILQLNLWQKGVSCSFIFGMYLIFTGLGRFVEESYRGEVQTPGFRGLRLYQWTASVSVVIGIIMTIIRIKPPEITPGLGWESVLVAGLTGLFLFFAMGVDFPASNARFSRLV
jgi:prolipoprotein diacylglyceryltransferase/protein-S-isoprenylcysteine O-methyltransferase Ste14